MISERKAAILEALIDAHIRTGEPVSSRAVLEAVELGVSAATVRNELVALEREGLVAQPHTSAGRVPTDAGYRYYVDHVSAGRLRNTMHQKIDGFFTTVQRELSSMLQDTTNLLAELTSYPAVVLGPGLGSDPVHAVHLVPLGPTSMLVIVISDSGRVTKELAQLRDPASPQDLQDAETTLTQLFAGKPAAAAESIASEAASAGLEAAQLAILTAAAKVTAKATIETQDLYLGGTSQLTSLWEDLSKVHRILELLEQRASVDALLDRGGMGTVVRIGSELSVEEVDLAVVSTGYGDGPGRVGVLGPMRMDYRKTIKVVEEVGEGLADNLSP